MNALDVLLWLLIALLAGLAYAVEAGAATRHKKVVVSTMFTVLASIVYLLFLVDDKTSMKLDPYQEAAKKGSKGAVSFSDGGASKKEEADKGGAGAKDGSDGDGALTGKDDKSLDKIFADCDGCPSMVRIPVGKFQMGSPDEEPGRQPNEGPMKTIAISREIAVGRFEITRREFNEFVKATGYQSPVSCVTGPKPTPKADWRNPGFEQAPSHPAVCIAYREALAYTQWLSKKSGKIYRLPTESEWEYVARAGTTTAYSVGNTVAATQANFGRSRDGTTPVGFSGANPFGVYEVHGSAAELVLDCWADDILDIPEEGSPYESFSDCKRGVIRGGSWQSPAWEARSASRRVLGDANMPMNTVGFRVVREIDGTRGQPGKVSASSDAPKSDTEPPLRASAPVSQAARPKKNSQDHLE